MDEIKPNNQHQEQSSLRPDTSDRPIGRSRQSASTKPKMKKPQFFLSRQHIMMGIGILVLLLLILAISSALKAPTNHEQSSSNAERTIALSGTDSSRQVTEPNPSLSEHSATSGQKALAQEDQSNIPSDITNALNEEQQGQQMPHIIETDQTEQKINTLPIQPTQRNTSSSHNLSTSLPPAPTTMPQRTKKPETKPAEQKLVATAETKPVVQQDKGVTPKSITPLNQQEQPAVQAKKTVAKQHTTVSTSTPKPKLPTQSAGSLESAPATNFTLQLSSASQPATLEAFAKQNSLSNYKVYKTERNGQPWFVLIQGNYHSVQDAKSAVDSMPQAIQAKNPWVRKIQQVQQDQK